MRNLHELLLNKCFYKTTLVAHAMCRNTAVTDLRLVRCGIDGKDITYLKMAFKDIHTLAVLDFSENHGITRYNGINEIGRTILLIFICSVKKWFSIVLLCREFEI